jgi:LacI family transcriptional regulator
MAGYGVVTLYDVASRAGVSIATVSRVLHGTGSVREDTRDRVRAAIEELGYVPDGAAQSLARNRKDVIGLVCWEHAGLKPDQHDIESISLVFYDEVMRGVEARIRERNWSLLVTFMREDESLGGPEPSGGRVDSRLRALSGKVDGLLIGEGILAAPAVAELAKRLPLVVVAGDPGQKGADVVAADNRAGARALAEHLVVDHGKRRLFHIDGPVTAPDATQRRLALREVLAEHPSAVLVGSSSGRFSVASGRRAAEQLLAEGGELPDALVCANDQMAIGALRALAAAGVRVPRDVAVVGFDDIFPSSLCEPPLTTVHQPIRMLGERACDRLITRIAEPSLRPKLELLPTELVLRSSCGCPPGPSRRRPVAVPSRRKQAAAPAGGGRVTAAVGVRDTAASPAADKPPVPLTTER